MGSFLARTFTWSQYDHVAMILKFESDPDEIFFVESTGNQGVAMNRWSFLRKHIGRNKFYKKCVFRHIECDRDQKMLESLEKFLKEVIGHKYKINPKDFLRRNTKKTCGGSNLIGSEISQIDENRTFFCSELIAKAFKILKIILNDSTPCSRFFPHHFSQKGDKFLKLTSGTSLEDELQIIIDTQDLIEFSNELLEEKSLVQD